MNIQIVKPAALSVIVFCSGCEKKLKIAGASEEEKHGSEPVYADLDAKAGTFYCQTCADKRRQ